MSRQKRRFILRGDRMMRDHSEELFKKYGFEKGLDLLNVMTARQFGMITERRAAHFVRKNVNFFTHENRTLQDA